jgi:hypothetical protein
MWNKFPSPTSLKQLEGVLQEEWYRIQLKIVQNLYEPIPRSIAAVLKANCVQHHTDKEMCTVSVVLPLFCSNSQHFNEVLRRRYCCMGSVPLERALGGRFRPFFRQAGSTHDLSLLDEIVV